MAAPKFGDYLANETPGAALPDGPVPRHGVHPDWSPGFWEKLERLGPTSEEFEDAVRAWVPSPTWRDRVVAEWIDELNSPEAADTSLPIPDPCSADRKASSSDETSG